MSFCSDVPLRAPYTPRAPRKPKVPETVIRAYPWRTPSKSGSAVFLGAQDAPRCEILPRSRNGFAIPFDRFTATARAGVGGGGMTTATTLDACRELDTLIAERVFGEVAAHAPCGDGLSRTSTYEAPTLAEANAKIETAYAGARERMGMKLWPAQYCGPAYSTDLAAAWDVVERLMETAFDVHLSVTHENRYSCIVRMGLTDSQEFAAMGCESPALAICLAALQAVQP